MRIPKLKKVSSHELIEVKDVVVPPKQAFQLEISTEGKVCSSDEEL